MGATPCKAPFGKPTVAIVLPSRTARLATTGNAANRPSALSNARSLAASTFTTRAVKILPLFGWISYGTDMPPPEVTCSVKVV